jgi:hypothetical protein
MLMPKINNLFLRTKMMFQIICNKIRVRTRFSNQLRELRDLFKIFEWETLNILTRSTVHVKL